MEGRPYIAMELVEGENARRTCLRRQGPLPIAEVWGLALQAAEALQAADRLGIVHRDVKPSNLLTRRRRPAAPSHRLRDLARRSEGEITAMTALDGQVLGTPA